MTHETFQAETQTGNTPIVTSRVVDSCRSSPASLLLRRPLLIAAVVVLHCSANSLAKEPAAKVDALNLTGAPLAAARRTAIAAAPFHRQLDAATIRRWMEISSQCTIAEFELFLAPLSPAESQLVEKMQTLTPPIVNRLHFEDLRKILRHGKLASYLVQQRENSHLVHTTPALENELYGAYDCVFASVGPPDGTPKYGDVIIRLRDSVRDRGWATPFSGMHFLYAIRHKDARKMQALLAAGKSLPTQATNPLSLGFDDRLHFANYVVTEKYWQKALAYQAILVARNADDSPAGKKVKSRFAQLLQTDSSEEFWKVFIPAKESGLSAEESAARVPFGYLEAKFDDYFSIKDFTSIEVPVDKLEKVRSWPEAQAHLELIHAKASDVP